MTEEQEIYDEIMDGLEERTSYVLRYERDGGGDSSDGIGVVVFGATSEEFPFAGMVVAEVSITSDGRPSILVRAWDEVLDPIVPVVMAVDDTVMITG